MFKTAASVYNDFYTGQFFYSKEKKKEDDKRKNDENGKIQEPDSHYLHNLFVTAVENLGEEEIRIHNEDVSKYRLFIDKYSIRGITIETKKVSAYQYEYLVRIKPKTLLGELDKFRCTW
jgi:hypothetical protein